MNVLAFSGVECLSPFFFGERGPETLTSHESKTPPRRFRAGIDRPWIGGPRMLPFVGSTLGSAARTVISCCRQWCPYGRQHRHSHRYLVMSSRLDIVELWSSCVLHPASCNRDWQIFPTLAQASATDLVLHCIGFGFCLSV